MAIEMLGAVYCPLSPRDSPQRIKVLVEETKSSLVIVHGPTVTSISGDFVKLDVDTILDTFVDGKEMNLDQLSNVVVTPENMAYIIFTSGSTGVPKAVRLKFFTSRSPG
jgi:D-alanine--poly(phosphoribitol) ligase subunit 1